jgi:murein L,D-transpeptidase YafK
MRVVTLCLILALGLSAGCARLVSYDGPEVTRVEVHKSARMLHLLHGTEVLESHPVELGFAPDGHKTTEGDGRTPQGRYVFDRRNPDSRYYLSIGVSYPDARDVAQARARGVSPGGDIFIHGTPRRFRGQDDWTAGCIAVSNRAMRRIYAMVGTGTVIDIFP